MKDKYKRTAEILSEIGKRHLDDVTNRVLLICNRVTDGTNFPSVTDECIDCKEDVWVSYATMATMAKLPAGGDILCLDCWIKRYDGKSDPMVAVYMSKEQVEELNAHRKV